MYANEMQMYISDRKGESGESVCRSEGQEMTQHDATWERPQKVCANLSRISEVYDDEMRRLFVTQTNFQTFAIARSYDLICAVLELAAINYSLFDIFYSDKNVWETSLKLTGEYVFKYKTL